MINTNFKPDKNSECLVSFNQSSCPFQIYDTSVPRYQKGVCIFLMSQKDTSYFHIGSTLFLRTTLRKYNAGGYVSGTGIVMHLKPFVLIAYICSFIKDMQMIHQRSMNWSTSSRCVAIGLKRSKYHSLWQWIEISVFTKK